MIYIYDLIAKDCGSHRYVAHVTHKETVREQILASAPGRLPSIGMNYILACVPPAPQARGWYTYIVMCAGPGDGPII